MTSQVRRRAAAGAAAVALLAAGAVGAAPGAHADPIADARARAAQLAREVQALTDRAEMATQRYDAIEARLAGAVNGSVSADRQVAALHSQIADAQQQVYARVQALYASAGDLDTFSALLSGDASAVSTRAQVTASVVTAQIHQMRTEQAMAQVAGAAASRQKLSTEQVVRLQARAARYRTQVVTLLARQQRALAGVNATIRRLVAQQQRAAAAASAQSFSQAVTTAGGHLDGGTRPPNATVAEMLAAARSRLGDPYVWGATGPDSFDCSGLTQWSYAHAGIALPRTAAEQWFSGPHPAMSQLEPGDLLFWAYDLNDPASIHHVAIYIGNGMMIAAPHTGENVQVQPVYLDGFFGATRPWAGGAS